MIFTPVTFVYLDYCIYHQSFIYLFDGKLTTFQIFCTFVVWWGIIEFRFDDISVFVFELNSIYSCFLYFIQGAAMRSMRGDDAKGRLSCWTTLMSISFYALIILLPFLLNIRSSFC